MSAIIKTEKKARWLWESSFFYRDGIFSVINSLESGFFFEAMRTAPLERTICTLQESLRDDEKKRGKGKLWHLLSVTQSTASF